MFRGILQILKVAASVTRGVGGCKRKLREDNWRSSELSVCWRNGAAGRKRFVGGWMVVQGNSEC